MKIEYIAGYFDAEGSLYIGKDIRRNNATRLSLEITNTHKDTLLRIQSFFGVGRVVKKFPSNLSRKELYRFRVYSRSDLKKVLCPMVPFLIEKRRKALELLSFC